MCPKHSGTLMAVWHRCIGPTHSSAVILAGAPSCGSTLYVERPWPCVTQEQNRFVSYRTLERLAHERALPSSTALSSGALWTVSNVLSHCSQRNDHSILGKHNGIHKVHNPSCDLNHNAIQIELKFCLVTDVLLWLTLRQHAILFPRRHNEAT